jgi:hypothetical protein
MKITGQAAAYVGFQPTSPTNMHECKTNVVVVVFLGFHLLILTGEKRIPKVTKIESVVGSV